MPALSEHISFVGLHYGVLCKYTHKRIDGVMRLLLYLPTG